MEGLKVNVLVFFSLSTFWAPATFLSRWPFRCEAALFWDASILRFMPSDISAWCAGERQRCWIACYRISMWISPCVVAPQGAKLLRVSLKPISCRYKPPGPGCGLPRTNVQTSIGWACSRGDSGILVSETPPVIVGTFSCVEFVSVQEWKAASDFNIFFFGITPYFSLFFRKLTLYT